MSDEPERAERRDEPPANPASPAACSPSSLHLWAAPAPGAPTLRVRVEESEDGSPWLTADMPPPEAS